MWFPYDVHVQSIKFATNTLATKPLSAPTPLLEHVHLCVYVWARCIIVTWERELSKIHKVGRANNLYNNLVFVSNRCGTKFSNKKSHILKTLKLENKKQGSRGDFIFNNPPLVFKIFKNKCLWKISEVSYTSMHVDDPEPNTLCNTLLSVWVFVEYPRTGISLTNSAYYTHSPLERVYTI